MIWYIYLCTIAALASSQRLFTSELCRAELERARHTVRSTAHELVQHEHQRQQSVLAELHATTPSGNYRSRRFAGANGNGPPALCPQPNTTMFPPQPITPAAGLEQDSVKIKKGRAASRRVSVPSIFRLHEVATDPYVMWMKKLHGHLNRDDAVCDGPSFKGLHTVTEDQLWGFASMLLVNYGSPLCPICHDMMTKLDAMIYKPNRLLLNEEEQHMHRMLFAAVPRTRAVCSAILPSCHADYAIKVANSSAGTECMKCTICRASLIAFQHRFLLDASMVKKALEWLNASFIHNICAELCISFPPGTPSEGGFFPHGVNYTECVAFSNNAFEIAVNASKNVLKPEFFCSVEMGWCALNESPSITHCLKELCVENLPASMGLSICRLIPDGKYTLPTTLKSPIFGPKLFPTQPQPSVATSDKSEL